MIYKSTRGGLSNLSFEDALFSGYARDGGLMVPETLPQLSLETLRSWATMSYPEVVKKVVSLFVTPDEVPTDDLSDLIDRALGRFDIKEVIRDVSFANLHITELWHGPSLAFKDLAMTCVGELYNYFLAKRKSKVIVIVGTSGDTGSSAIEAVRGKSNIDIIVMLPHQRISQIQELMMTTVIEDNVHVFSVDGYSDEFEVPMRQLFSDAKFCKSHNLCSINSINWGRIMVQIAHHIFVYLQRAETVGEAVDIVVPTGGCGNIASGVFAQMMGVPVKFVCVVNENDIIHRTFSNNDFHVAPKVTQTLAYSMDIQVPPNIERVLWLLSGKDCEVVKRVMETFETSGKADIPENVYIEMAKHIRTAVAPDEVIVETMRKCWKENGYLACPHTCAALAYYYGLSKHGTRETSGTRRSNGTLVPAAILSTASPDKFPEATREAGLEPREPPPRVAALFHRDTKSTFLGKDQNWEEELRKKITSISAGSS